MAPKLSETDLAMMTEEERQGFLDEDLVEEGEPGVDAGDDDDDDVGGDNSAGDKPDDEAGGDGDDDNDDDDAAAAAEAAKIKADEEASPAAAAAAAEAAKADGVADAGGDGSDTPDPNEKQPSWIVPNDLKEKLEDIDKKRDELAQKFDDGELTAQELREQLKPLDKEFRDIDSRLLRADIAKETAIEGWKDTVSGFFDVHAAYKTSDVLRGMLDAEVRRLQAEAINPLNPKILDRAHANIADEVKKAFGIDLPMSKKDHDKTADKPPLKAKARDEPPPNLGKVPAADATDADDGGEFSYLDRLSEKDSVAYEDALSKLSPAKLDAYMQRG